MIAAAIEDDLRTLDSAKHAWAALSLEIKRALLRTLKQNVFDIAPQWVAAAAQAKGLRPDSQFAGEEWISGPWAVLYALTRYERTLRDLEMRDTVQLPRIRECDGRAIVDVYPADLYDRLLLPGVRAEVWMQPGISAETVPLLEPPVQGRVALVLGAGNIASITPLDILYKLLAENCVCMVKMNPVNGYLQPFLEKAFEPFVKGGFVRFAAGGAELGAYLCGHSVIQTIHVTGSEATYRAIVREAPGKELTGELGNVSPIVVVPGEWTTAQIRYQAQNIATQKAHNAGFNCIAGQIVVVSADWPQKDALKAAVREVFASMEQRPEYYPGAAERRARFAPGSALLRPIVDVDDASEIFESEAFCGVLGWHELHGDGGAFLQSATAFCNERLMGTLGAQIVIAPAQMRSHKTALQRAIEDLRYGCIGVNAWTGVGYFLAETPWGAYPGAKHAHPGSGNGVVHNAFFLKDTEKSVIYAPFRSLPKPPWFVTNRAAAHIGRALCTFELSRTPAAFAKVASIALRG